MLDDSANDAKRYSHSAPGNGHQIKRRQRSWTHRTPPQQAAKNRWWITCTTPTSGIIEEWASGRHGGRCPLCWDVAGMLLLFLGVRVVVGKARTVTHLRCHLRAAGGTSERWTVAWAWLAFNPAAIHPGRSMAVEARVGRQTFLQGTWWVSRNCIGVGQQIRTRKEGGWWPEPRVTGMTPLCSLYIGPLTMARHNLYAIERKTCEFLGNDALDFCKNTPRQIERGRGSLGLCMRAFWDTKPPWALFCRLQ